MIRLVDNMTQTKTHEVRYDKKANIIRDQVEMRQLV